MFTNSFWHCMRLWDWNLIIFGCILWLKDRLCSRRLKKVYQLVIYPEQIMKYCMCWEIKKNLCRVLLQFRVFESLPFDKLRQLHLVWRVCFAVFKMKCRLVIRIYCQLPGFLHCGFRWRRLHIHIKICVSSTFDVYQLCPPFSCSSSGLKFKNIMQLCEVHGCISHWSPTPT